MFVKQTFIRVEDLKKKGLVRDSRSPWAFPVTLVPKADGQKRLCVDYRRLNALTIDNKMPLPNIQEVIDRLQGAKYFTSLDIASGYWHVEMAPDSTEKTAFITNERLFECPKFLLYGIDEAPSFADHPITLKEARSLARENTRKAQIKRKNHHDDKHPDVEFSEGDQVLRTVAKHHPYMSKLSPRQQGPFFVKKKISSLLYDIQDTEGRVYRSHASQLRSFMDRESLGAGECDGVLTHHQF
ncbi:K02A2.6-like [Cordylochernes scorpioides]|uniref:K02A2.6-like n=1 Tax=Cordylochernes scorpioides TaxID=51811 RepID=A0ABY6LAP0_9ARAC|nr:K02A2.6-like [Cordylochernes scorpioides]